MAVVLEWDSTATPDDAKQAQHHRLSRRTDADDGWFERNLHTLSHSKLACKRPNEILIREGSIPQIKLIFITHVFADMAMKSRIMNQ